MLALVVARSGPVRDGLVALLDALPDVRQIVQVAQADDAWEFAQSTCPEITLIHASSLSTNLSDFILKVKSRCSSPLLIITTSEEERQTAVSQGADVAEPLDRRAAVPPVHLVELGDALRGMDLER